MSLDQAMKKLKFDSRMIEHNLNNGSITREEYEAHLKSLPDSQVQAAALTLEDEKPSASSASSSHTQAH
jgi:hypothetical protein